MKTSLIVLTTDFGTQDPFVGIMKGVIAGLAPNASFVDVTHAIPPGDIQRGAIVLWQAVPYFPPGTVFLSVVDPGVGTERKGIILNVQGKIFIGPDNGLFSYIVAGEKEIKAWELAKLAESAASSTFHGRDVFAPAAAQAALGVEGAEFGPKCAQLTCLPHPTLDVVSKEELHGEIISTDQFGNLLTSLGRFLPADAGQFTLSPWLNQPLPVVKFSPDEARVLLPSGDALSFVNTFGQVPPAKCAALIGSTGLIELVANRQSAAKLLNLKRGEKITLTFD